jgi:hypothetical protein
MNGEGDVEQGFESCIQFYSEKYNNYSILNNEEDDQYNYDPKGGFPAFKYFRTENKHYLLIAGGIDSNMNASNKV